MYGVVRWDGFGRDLAAVVILGDKASVGRRQVIGWNRWVGYKFFEQKRVLTTWWNVRRRPVSFGLNALVEVSPSVSFLHHKSALITLIIYIVDYRSNERWRLDYPRGSKALPEGTLAERALLMVIDKLHCARGTNKPPTAAPM